VCATNPTTVPANANPFQCSNTSLVNATCVATCKVGFAPGTAGAPIVTCGLAGSWSGVTGSCVRGEASDTRWRQHDTRGLTAGTYTGHVNPGLTVATGWPERLQVDVMILPQCIQCRFGKQVVGRQLMRNAGVSSAQNAVAARVDTSTWHTKLPVFLPCLQCAICRHPIPPTGRSTARQLAPSTACALQHVMLTTWGCPVPPE
jgi:hypothetical protein